MIDKDILPQEDYSLCVAYTSFKLGFQLGLHACRTVVWQLGVQLQELVCLILLYLLLSEMIFITISIYYMANPVLGKSLCSDWFFLGQDFAVRTVSMETVQSVYFCFGAKPANLTFATKTAKKCENCHSSH